MNFLAFIESGLLRFGLLWFDDLQVLSERATFKYCTIVTRLLPEIAEMQLCCYLGEIHLEYCIILHLTSHYLFNFLSPSSFHFTNDNNTLCEGNLPCILKA